MSSPDSHHHHEKASCAGRMHSHFDFSHISHQTLKKWVTRAAVAVGIVLVVMKLAAWWMVGSVSILSSLTDSVLDLLASTINLFAVRHAMRPADGEHRYGHGKIEAIAALTQAVIIFIAAIFVYYEGIHHILHPAPLDEPAIGMGVMGISIALVTGLVLFQSYAVRKTRSIAITSDSLHYKADLFLNVGVLASLMCTVMWDFRWIDPVVGIGIGTYIMMAAFKITREAFNILMDHELDEETKKLVLAIIQSHPEVHGFHEMKTRTSGTQDFMQIHLELEGSMSLTEAHRISIEIEEKVLQEFPRLHLTIHQDPKGLKENHRPL